MRRRTVRLGLNFTIAAILIVIMGTFYHSAIADLFHLLPIEEEQFVFLSFFIGGASGGFGALTAAAGFLLGGTQENQSSRTRLLPNIIILCAVTIIFFMLFVSSFHTPTAPELPPGETITI